MINKTICVENEIMAAMKTIAIVQRDVFIPGESFLHPTPYRQVISAYLLLSTRETTVGNLYGIHCHPAE